MPPYLEAGNVSEYRKTGDKSGTIRNGYGLFSSNNGWYGAGNVATEIAAIKARAAAKSVKVVVKGIMCKEDALEAVAHGADAVWISNGGGAKAYSSPSTISVLKSIANAVKSSDAPQTEIFIDSAITRGTDVLKCLAYGANAVFLGRPVMWALKHNGQAGCTQMMDILNEELRLAMALTHCFKVSEVTERQVIHRVRALPEARL
jgi:isopentenyl diphosphate isomerase/L-lactate dehydrogenase-like FMN-dependent dehydrogenase